MYLMTEKLPRKQITKLQGKVHRKKIRTHLKSFGTISEMIELQILFEIQNNPNITAEQMAEKIIKTRELPKTTLQPLRICGKMFPVCLFFCRM
jgi:hydroxymethylglutaryl-CoA reductase